MRILIVDDRPLSIEVLRSDILREEPRYRVEGATAVEAALELAQGAQPHFDVFLLDQNLEDQPLDGIELLFELRRISPRSDAMVFTGDNIAREGRRAIEAGACDYFTKPVDPARLLAQLRRLQRERGTRAERDWLAALADVGRELQAAATVQAVGQVMVEAAPRLGFRRAQLWLHQSGAGEMVGLCQYGNRGMEGFRGLRLPLHSMPDAQAALHGGEPATFRSDEAGQEELERRFAAEGFAAAVGDRIALPLLAGERSLGVMILDNGSQPYTYRPEQRDLLRIFGAHAAVALDRAIQEEEEQQREAEYRTLSGIGRHITTQAAEGNLEKLLDEVRTQVGTLMNVDNFMVVLLDHETQTLDFRRQYEGGQLVNRHWRSGLAGISGHVFAVDKPILIRDTQTYCAAHAIGQFGRPAACWLGVPLHNQAGAFGVLVVQDYTDQNAYSADQERLLAGVADQVGGAIQMAYRLERQSEQEQQARALALLDEALPRLAQESEDNFWHAVLTTVTHREGLSFNRAALFWYDQAGNQMQGRMGIGHFNRRAARRAWEEDAQAGRTLQEYLDKPYLVRVQPTPLEKEIVHWLQETDQASSPCRAIHAKGSRIRLTSTALGGYLPPKLLHVPDLLDNAASYACALVPVKADGEVCGLLLVDNAFDGEPLRDSDLDRLEQLLREAMQVWQHIWVDARHMQRFGQAYQDILSLGRRITAQATTRPLQESLVDLCHSVQAVTGADCVMIYPLGPGGGSYEANSVAHVGLEQPAEASALGNRGVQGVSLYVLRSGALVAPDVSKFDLLFGGRRLDEHRIIQRERIAALIAAPIREAATGESLGIIYFDYRTPKQFSEQDVALAEHIAGIASTAISYLRGFQHETQSRAVAEAGQRKRQQEMQIFSNIQAQALSFGSDEKQAIHTILQNANELFDRSARLTLAVLEWDKREEQAPLKQREYQLTALGKLSHRSRKIGHGLAGAAIKAGASQHARNEYAIPIRLEEHCIGALLIQKHNQREGFDFWERETIERLATVAALALGNTRSSEHLRTLSATVSTLSDPSGLAATRKAIVKSVRKMAPDVDCITIWHLNTEDPPRLVLGETCGEWPDAPRTSRVRNRRRLVEDLMQREQPLFEPDVSRNESLRSAPYTKEQEVASVAALPLRVAKEADGLGVLFLNYRTPHKFTSTERILLPILATASATAIRVAQANDVARSEQERFAAAVEVATAVGATLNIDEVLRKVLGTLRDRFLARDADHTTSPYIMLYDKMENVLMLPPVARDFYEIDRAEYKSRMRLPLEGPGITCRVARRSLAAGEMVTENVPDVLDATREKDYVEANSSTRSELCIGLIREGKLLGVLVLKSSKVGAFSKEDERLCELVAHQVAVALERASEVAEKRVSDYLTGAMAWAADVAHDINVDVGYIRYRTSWLLGAVQEEEQREWVREIDQRAGELADKARDDRSERKEAPVLLSPFLEKKVREWHVRHSPDTRIVYDWCSDAEVAVKAYPEQIWKAVRHLLRNAIEAMHHQGRIDLRLHPVASEMMELQVENSGPDIPPEVRERIFREPFTTKNSENGGMGLLIAKMLLEKMNGSIKLLPSQPGRGPIFAIRVPQGRDT